MQDNSELNLKQNVFSKNILLGAKWLFGLILTYILYQTFKQKEQNFELILIEFKKIFVFKNVLNLMIIFTLILINWAFEAKKWQVLSNGFNPLSFTDSYKSVLVGLSFGFITPANLGDFGGRVLHLENNNRKQGIGAILLGNGIQFYVSLLFGIFAYLMFFGLNLPKIHQIIFGLLIICLVLGIFIYVRRDKIALFLDNFDFFSSYKIYWKSLIKFDNSTFLGVFVCSILRFLVISLQFVFAFQLFNIDVRIVDLWSISCLVLLFKTIIPQVNFLTDLGVRQLSALHFFSMLSVNLSAVISAMFFVWLVNILFPVLVGSLLFLQFKNR